MTLAGTTLLTGEGIPFLGDMWNASLAPLAPSRPELPWPGTDVHH